MPPRKGASLTLPLDFASVMLLQRHCAIFALQTESATHLAGASWSNSDPVANRYLRQDSSLVVPQLPSVSFHCSRRLLHALAAGCRGHKAAVQQQWKASRCLLMPAGTLQA
jgi:hypothetical protein